jgi:putative oxidoreductase
MEKIRQLCRLGLKVLNYLAWLPPLITRLAIGWGFHIAGTAKIGADISGFVEKFKSLGIPFPEFNVRFVGSIEYYGGVLLMFGFLTRPVAFLLTASMFVALITGNLTSVAEIFTKEGDPTDILPVMFGTYVLWLLVYGPGIVSIDALLRKWIGVDEKETPATPTQPA